MFYSLHSRLFATGMAALAISGCAGAGDRYPELNLRDFERVQGTFTSAGAESEPKGPTAISAKSLSEIESALAQASQRHANFLNEAVRARTAVQSAAGTSIDDNRWPIALIEIATLESRHGEMASLLADLDAMYADASFGFSERQQIEAARSEVAAIYTSERQIIAELVSILETQTQP